MAISALEKLGVDLGKVRHAVEGCINSGEQITQEMIFNPRAKRAIELTFEEARDLSCNYLGVEHLLLGCIRACEDATAQVLANLGVDLEKLRETLRALTPNRAQSMLDPFFTEPARRSIVLAREAAQRFGSGNIGVEHILIGIISYGDSPALRALEKLSIDPAKVRAGVEELISRGEPLIQENMDFTLQAKRAIELGFGEARRFNHRHVGAEHLLLGCIGASEDATARVLASLRVDASKVRELLRTSNDP